MRYFVISAEAFEQMKESDNAILLKNYNYFLAIDYAKAQNISRELEQDNFIFEMVGLNGVSRNG